MTFRSQFVTDLHRLDIAETRKRLATVRTAVDRRLDELESLREPALRTDLLIANDEVSSSLMATARHGIERLATALAVSHGEAAQPPDIPVFQTGVSGREGPPRVPRFHGSPRTGEHRPARSQHPRRQRRHRRRRRLRHPVPGPAREAPGGLHRPRGGDGGVER